MHGRLPAAVAWRSAADTRIVDTPDGLYCKLPQDSPIGVRGARNYPCQGQPGKRAPTVEICESDKPFEPLAMRQHVFGPYPLDPNLIAQGIPPDDRVNWNRERIFGPVDGTPMPPGIGPPAPAPMGEVSPIAPIDTPSPAPQAGPPGGAPSAAPSGFGGDASRPGPSVALAQYNPQNGTYVTPDGQVFRQSNLVARDPSKGPKSWKDMFAT